VQNQFGFLIDFIPPVFLLYVRRKKCICATPSLAGKGTLEEKDEKERETIII
jgi:hypothetical protein